MLRNHPPFYVLRSLVYISILFFSTTSCRNENRDQLPEVNRSVTVEEVKSAILSLAAGSKNASEPIYLWEYATAKKNEHNEEYVQVPFDNKTEERMAYDKTGGYYNLPQEQLIGKKRKDGSIELFKMEVFPTYEYSKTHGVLILDNDFTGTQIFKDMNDHITDVFHYTGGQLNNRKSGRVSEEFCEILYRQFFQTTCANSASATVYGKWVYWNWTNMNGNPQSPTPTGNPEGVNPWIECENWTTAGFPEEVSNSCEENTGPTPPTPPTTGGGGGQAWVGQNGMTPQLFLQSYILQGPTHPINPSLKLDCFGTVPDDPKYKYSITIYVDQPHANSRSIANWNMGSVQRRPGHSYIGLERYDSNSGETVRLVMGFYVQSELMAMTGIYTGGAWGDDGGTNYDVSLKIDDITPSEFKDVVYILKAATTPQYHLVNFNCTTFIYNLLGVYEVLPLGRGWIGPMGIGMNPADFGQDLRERANQYGNKLTVGDNLTSPPTTNCN